MRARPRHTPLLAVAAAVLVAAVTTAQGARSDGGPPMQRALNTTSALDATTSGPPPLTASGPFALSTPALQLALERFTSCVGATRATAPSELHGAPCLAEGEAYAAAVTNASAVPGFGVPLVTGPLEPTPPAAAGLTVELLVAAVAANASLGVALRDELASLPGGWADELDAPLRAAVDAARAAASSDVGPQLPDGPTRRALQVLLDERDAPEPPQQQPGAPRGRSLFFKSLFRAVTCLVGAGGCGNSKPRPPGCHLRWTYEEQVLCVTPTTRPRLDVARWPPSASNVPANSSWYSHAHALRPLPRLSAPPPPAPRRKDNGWLDEYKRIKGDHEKAKKKGKPDQRICICNDDKERCPGWNYREHLCQDGCKPIHCPPNKAVFDTKKLADAWR